MAREHAMSAQHSLDSLQNPWNDDNKTDGSVTSHLIDQYNLKVGRQLFSFRARPRATHAPLEVIVECGHANPADGLLYGRALGTTTPHELEKASCMSWIAE
eukprot:scaffold138611_cov33-Tisochrysis_lutea.AAC.4